MSRGSEGGAGRKQRAKQGEHAGSKRTGERKDTRDTNDAPKEQNRLKQLFELIV